MIRQRLRSKNLRRRNDGQRFFCDVCQCYVTNIRRHERTKKQLNNSNPNYQHQNRSLLSVNYSSTHSPTFQTNSTNTNTSLTHIFSNQVNSNNQLHDNSLIYDLNNATSINDAQSIPSNGSYMNDDVSIDANN